MTVTILTVAAIGCFAAGMSFMSLVQHWERALYKPIPGDLLPQKVSAPPPSRQSEPQTRSPFAPKPKAVILQGGHQPNGGAKPKAPSTGSGVERLAKPRQFHHWPIARPEPERPPTMVEVRPRPRPGEREPAALPEAARGLPSIEWGSS